MEFFVCLNFISKVMKSKRQRPFKNDLVANMMHLPFANWLVRESMLMLEEKKNCMVWVLNS